MELSNFDVNDRNSWYFGALSRQEATEILQTSESGVFLVRDSSSLKGFVLSVSEGSKVSHYIINSVLIDGLERFQMGDQVFIDLQEILSFYKKHYLDSTNLIRPAKKSFEQVIAKFDFEGNDFEDLPFKKGDIMTIISKDEQQWWTARNAVGKIGQIPVPYVEKHIEIHKCCNDKVARRSEPLSTPDFCFTGKFETRTSLNSSNSLSKPDLNRQLPAFARVKQARVPNAYDKTALKLEVDDIIKVTKTNINGQWEGELHGRIGHFPFTHIEFLQDDSNA
ncbi:CRKL.2 family protein [Megaselia abdita]